MEKSGVQGTCYSRRLLAKGRVTIRSLRLDVLITKRVIDCQLLWARAHGPHMTPFHPK